VNIVIIGCGYIGCELAAIWKKNGHTITATTSNPDKLEPLARSAQKSFLLKGNDAEELAPLIANNDIICIPISIDCPETYENAYHSTAQLFRHLALEMDLPRHLIYISSASLYGDHSGQWVDETSPLKATGDLAKDLIDAERVYLSLQELGWHVCILRISEVYGPGREISHRVKQLEGHTMPGSGEQYTNMVHKLDCVTAVDYALRHHLEGIYNLADDDHHSRKDLFEIISRKFRYPHVKWDPAHTPLHTGNKRVSNHKIKAEGFAFRHPLRLLD
jgi:nucleoside-diphosphate-sugar epimerase